MISVEGTFTDIYARDFLYHSLIRTAVQIIDFAVCWQLCKVSNTHLDFESFKTLKKN